MTKAKAENRAAVKDKDLSGKGTSHPLPAGKKNPGEAPTQDAKNPPKGGAPPESGVGVTGAAVAAGATGETSTGGVGGAQSLRVVILAYNEEEAKSGKIAEVTKQVSKSPGLAVEVLQKDLGGDPQLSEVWIFYPDATLDDRAKQLQRALEKIPELAGMVVKRGQYNSIRAEQYQKHIERGEEDHLLIVFPKQEQ